MTIDLTACSAAPHAHKRTQAEEEHRRARKPSFSFHSRNIRGSVENLSSRRAAGEQATSHRSVGVTARTLSRFGFLPYPLDRNTGTMWLLGARRRWRKQGQAQQEEEQPPRSPWPREEAASRFRSTGAQAGAMEAHLLGAWLLPCVGLQKQAGRHGAAPAVAATTTVPSF